LNLKYVQLSDVCDLQNGYAFKSTDYVEKSDTCNIRMSNIRPGGNFNEFHNQRYLPDSYAEEYKEYLLNDADLIIAMTDMATETKILGLPTLVNNTTGRNFLLNQRVGKLCKFSDDIHAPYLRHILTAQQVIDYYKSKGAGGLQINISKKDILSVKFPLPSLATQQKIVAKLDAIFAEIEKAFAAADANIKNAEALFQSYLTEVFELGSEGWQEIKIKELGKVVTGNTPKTNEPENYGDFISFVKPGDFKGDGSIDLDKQKLSLIGMNKSRVIDEKSALMVCIGATIGKCGYTETKIVTNQQVNSITPTEQFNYVFIYLQMLTNDFQNRVKIRSGQATLPIINKSKWESLTLKFPSLGDQIKIVNRFNILRLEIDNIRNSNLSKLNELNILRQSILKKAFSGELVKD